MRTVASIMLFTGRCAHMIVTAVAEYSASSRCTSS